MKFKIIETTYSSSISSDSIDDSRKYLSQRHAQKRLKLKELEKELKDLEGRLSELDKQIDSPEGFSPLKHPDNINKGALKDKYRKVRNRWLTMNKEINSLKKSLGIREKKKDKIKGGIGDETCCKDVDQEQLKMGMKVEMEYTDDKSIAKEIAIDHLTEDPKYYTKLKKMENK